MSYDLQLMRDAAPRSIQPRDIAIYVDAQTAERKTARAHNIADLLERGHRSRPNGQSGILLDVRA